MTVSADTLPSHPVLFINPRSGSGKAQHHDLVGHCRQKGIEPIVLEQGDDLASLVAAAVSSGADAIGMAGGDGSQAQVAAVAAAHDLPYVCVPAGTRNHFALDIGIDRDDVVGALDAFHHGSERRIDLAQVNGRVFVNNASMGLYGKVVQSPEYRDAKLRTVIEMLPDLLGPSAEPFDLRFTGPDGAEYRGAQLVLVSNNRYQLDPVGTQGTRGKMNQGTLGVIVAPGGSRSARGGNGPPQTSKSTPRPPSRSAWTAKHSHLTLRSDLSCCRRPCGSDPQPARLTRDEELPERNLPSDPRPTRGAKRGPPGSELPGFSEPRCGLYGRGLLLRHPLNSRRLRAGIARKRLQRPFYRD